MTRTKPATVEELRNIWYKLEPPEETISEIYISAECGKAAEVGDTIEIETHERKSLYKVKGTSLNKRKIFVERVDRADTREWR